MKTEINPSEIMLDLHDLKKVYPTPNGEYIVLEGRRTVCIGTAGREPGPASQLHVHERQGSRYRGETHKARGPQVRVQPGLRVSAEREYSPGDRLYRRKGRPGLRSLHF